MANTHKQSVLSHVVKTTAARLRLPVEYLTCGIGVGALLSAATLLAVGTLLTDVLRIVDPVSREFSRRFFVAAFTAAAAAIMVGFFLQDLRRERANEPPEYYPRRSVGFVVPVLAAIAATIAFWPLMFLPGPENRTMELFHHIGVPSQSLLTAAILAAVGGLAAVVWASCRARRIPREWVEEPWQPLQWRPLRPPRWR